MKTLKTITTNLLLLFTVTVFGQTKEETLEWLNQNTSYCYSYHKYDGDSYERSYTFYEDYLVEKDYWSFTKSTSFTKIYYKDILLREISQLDVENNSKTNPPITSIRIHISKKYYMGGGNFSYEEIEASRFNFRYETDQPNARKNLEKVLRAIMHMAKLHGAEPYKDLFGE